MPAAEALATATPEDRAAAMARFGCEVRCAEWLTWRNVVREVLGNVRIEYNPEGAPMVVGTPSPIYISISHCRSHIAVAISDEPCGVDVEWCRRNFERVASRYLSLSERMLEFSQPDLMVGAAWCAKEAVYKYYCAQGEKYADFRGELRIVSCNMAQGSMHIEAGSHEAVEVAIKWQGDLIIATVGGMLQAAQASNLEE